jgi:hypothetical protein
MPALKFVRSVSLNTDDCETEVLIDFLQVWESFRANSGLEPRYDVEGGL